MNDEQDAMLAAALRYIRYGWPMLPLAGVEPDGADGWRCTCPSGPRCPSPGKHPRTRNGLMDATLEERVVRGWFRSFLNLNIGIRTGISCDVLDLDTEGPASLARWTGTPLGDSPADTILSIWAGPVAQTGRGFHLFARPESAGNRSHMLPGIDFRSDDGFFVASPSRHISGRRYTWLRLGKLERRLLPSAPPWLHDLLYPSECAFLLRSGRRCSKTVSHVHGEVIFRSSIEKRWEATAINGP